MSVINQVLRDLDKRQQNAQGARVRSHYQPVGGRPWLLLGTVSAAIVISAIVTWWLVAHALTPSDYTETGAEGESAQVAGVPTEPGDMPQELAQPLARNEVEPHNGADESAVQPAQSTKQAEPSPTPVGDVALVATPSSMPSKSATVAAEPNLAPEQNTSAQPNQGTQPDEEAQAEESRGEMKVQRVERSASELASQRLDQAVDAMESGEGRRAESLLQEALVLAPEFVDARQQLAAYYYGRGFASEALRVLREGLAHSPSNSRLLTLSARIYEESDRADEALEMLNRVDADLPRQNEIVVLRAALANELGQYQIAADDYRQLLGGNPDQGIWWLGLGVAEEGRTNYDAARRAFQRAGEDRRLDRASREYARSREQELATW